MLGLHALLLSSLAALSPDAGAGAAVDAGVAPAPRAFDARWSRVTAPAKGPPLAVRMIRSMAWRRSKSKTWKIALCSLSTGRSRAPQRRALLETIKANVAAISAAAEKERWQADRDLWQAVVDVAAAKS